MWRSCERFLRELLIALEALVLVPPPPPPLLPPWRRSHVGTIHFRENEQAASFDTYRPPFSCNSATSSSRRLEFAASFEGGSLVPLLPPSLSMVTGSSPRPPLAFPLWPTMAAYMSSVAVAPVTEGGKGTEERRREMTKVWRPSHKAACAMCVCARARLRYFNCLMTRLGCALTQHSVTFSPLGAPPALAPGISLLCLGITFSVNR